MSAMERWPHAGVDHLRFNADGLIPAITQDWLDGDGDALPMTVEQVGARACHTGARSCCFEASAKPSAGGAQEVPPPATPPIRPQRSKRLANP